MEVDLNCKAVMKIDIDEYETFRLLLKTLYMYELITDNVHHYYTRKNSDDEMCVYEITNGNDELIDDRGDLYNALIELAKCIIPNF